MPRALTNKGLLIFIFLIFLVSLLVFRNSFNLAFDGDSYLTLWRYLDTVEKQRLYTPFSYLLTDYGPQDASFALQYKIFGLSPIFFYSISFMIRFLASLGILYFIVYLTKNRTAGFLSGLLFSVSATGIETTNWVFNMPSYIAILFLSLLFIVYFKQKESSSITLTICFWALFILTVLIQPIRMAFLPLLFILIEFYFFIVDRKKRGIKGILIQIIICLAITFFVFAKGGIGNSIGIYGSEKERLSGSWIPAITSYFEIVSGSPISKDIKVLFYPIAQIGKVIYPDSMYPKRLIPIIGVEVRTIKVSLFFTVCYLLILIFSKNIFPLITKKQKTFSFITFLVWTLLVWYFFIQRQEYALLGTNYLAFLVGGMFLSLNLLFITAYKDRSKFVAIPLLLMLFSFIIPWFRSPTIIQETINRYLIVGAAATAYFVGMLFAISAKDRHKHLSIGVLILILLNSIASQKYLNSLFSSRSYYKTEQIRSMVPDNSNFGDPNEPLIYFFESDNKDILYHSLLFGFPVIMAFEKGFWYWSNIAYTDSWYEFQDAFETGDSLKRFPVKSGRIPLENMYSFKIENGQLVETTKESRKKLLE